VTVSIALPLLSITGRINGVTVSVAVSVAVSVTVSGEGDGDRLQYLALISSGHSEYIAGDGVLIA